MSALVTVDWPQARALADRGAHAATRALLTVNQAAAGLLFAYAALLLTGIVAISLAAALAGFDAQTVTDAGLRTLAAPTSWQTPWAPITAVNQEIDAQLQDRLDRVREFPFGGVR